MNALISETIRAGATKLWDKSSVKCSVIKFAYDDIQIYNELHCKPQKHQTLSLAQHNGDKIEEW